MFIYKLKHKALVVLGLVFSIFTVMAVVFGFWKTFFYIESNKLGLQLTHQLLESAKKNDPFPFNDILDDPAYFYFREFNYYPKDVYEKIKIKPGIKKTDCESMTDLRSFYSYSASIKCHIDNESVYFYFTKEYDFINLLRIILVAGGLTSFGLYRFFVYVARLQELNIQNNIELQKEKLILEVGAKLVHDLKKGVIARLNYLKQEFGSNLDFEMMQPDFKQNLKSKLARHFEQIDFLNKYINLLTSNLKNEKENNWILLNSQKLKEYLNLVFPTKKFSEDITPMQNILAEFICYPENSTSKLILNNNFLDFKIPEMSFFRILKNLSENYNAYGQDEFSLKILHDSSNHQILLQTENKINKAILQNENSTNLGHTIIKRLLSDNFGNKSKLKVYKDDFFFKTEINIPLD